MRYIGRPSACAMASAAIVLPVPGGPANSTARPPSFQARAVPHSWWTRVRLSIARTMSSICSACAGGSTSSASVKRGTTGCASAAEIEIGSRGRQHLVEPRRVRQRIQFAADAGNRRRLAAEAPRQLGHPGRVSRNLRQCRLPVADTLGMRQRRHLQGRQVGPRATQPAQERALVGTDEGQQRQARQRRRL